MRTCLLALLLLSALPCQVSAQSPVPSPTPQDGGNGYMPEDSVASEVVYVAGPNEFPSVDLPPEPIYFNEFLKSVKYPKSMKGKGISGKVYLRVLVDENGNAGQIIILKSASIDFEETAKESLLNLRFTPAEKDGKPVKCWLEFYIHITLKAHYIHLIGTVPRNKPETDKVGPKTVSGIVTDAFGNPLESVNVIHFDPDSFQVAQTVSKTDGSFILNNELLLGSEVLFLKEGYYAAYAQPMSAFGNKVVLESFSAPPRSEMNQLVEGIVLDTTTSLPQRDVFVVLYDAKGNQVAQGLTNQWGQFFLPAVYADGMFILLAKEGYFISNQLLAGPKENKLLLAPIGRFEMIVGKDRIGEFVPTHSTGFPNSITPSKVRN